MAAKLPGVPTGYNEGGGRRGAGSRRPYSRVAFELPIWMRGDFLVRRGPRAAALVRRDFAKAFDAHRLLERASWRPRTEGHAAEEEGDGAPGRGPVVEARRAGRSPVPRAQAAGRGPLREVDAGAIGRAVLRPYRRGGLVRHLSRRRHLLGHRAFRELVVTERLRREGVPVPEGLAAVQVRRLPGYEAALVTLRIPDARPAARLLREADPDGAAMLLRRIASSVHRLHAAGVWHADLNAHNLLVPASPEAPVVVIDLDRSRLLPPPLPGFLARRNLRRLRRSLAREGLTAALDAWRALEAAYEVSPRPPGRR